MRRRRWDGFCLSLLPSLQGWICGFVGAQTSQATAARESTLGTLTNEVSLSTMRLGRGWEWAVKKARMDAKEET